MCVCVCRVVGLLPFECIKIKFFREKKSRIDSFDGRVAQLNGHGLVSTVLYYLFVQFIYIYKFILFWMRHRWICMYVCVRIYMSWCILPKTSKRQKKPNIKYWIRQTDKLFHAWDRRTNIPIHQLAVSSFSLRIVLLRLLQSCR